MSVSESTSGVAAPQESPAPEDRPAADAPGLRLAPVLAFLLAALLAFHLLRLGTVAVATEAPEFIAAWCAVIGLATGAFVFAPYALLPDVLRRFLRAGTIFLILYFAIEPFDIPHAALEPGHPALAFHGSARWVGLALAIVGLRIPVVVFASAMVLWMTRELQTAITGFYFSTLDIRNVAEVIALAALGASLLAAAARRPRLAEAIDLDAPAMRQAAIVILAVGIGGHLGNYFYSAIAKLSLDGGPLSWLLENRLYEGMIGGVEKRTMPFMASPAATQVVHDAMKFLNAPMVWGSFLAQFAAIIAPWRRTWMMALTVLYDLFHIIVYVTFGLLFWKWIALNTIIVVTLARMNDADWRRYARIPCLVFVLIGSIFFRTATLAWYDAPGFISVYFVAETTDGKRYRVPTAYWGSSSYQVSQGRMYVPENADHFNFNIWGSVLAHDDLMDARACEAPFREAPDPARYGPVEIVRNFVAARHEQVLERVNEEGRFNYYLLPHHHMPAPFVDDPFYAVDKREIASYIYVLESVCLGLEDGELRRRVIARDEIPVYETGAGARSGS